MRFKKKTITLANLTTYDTKIKELLNKKLDTVVFWDELYSAIGSIEIPGSEINDATTSKSSTWSSNKIDNVITEVASMKADTQHIHDVVKSISLTGTTLSCTMDNGTTKTFKTVDTTYKTGTNTVSGITKLYNGIGDNTDGSMTQNAITTALSAKSDTTHSHNPSECSAVWHAGRNVTVDDMNNANYNWPYMASVTNTNSGSIGLESCWHHLQYFRHMDNNGFGAQLAIPLDDVDSSPIKWRGSIGTNWHSWHVIYDDRTVIKSTTDLTAGSSSLANNFIYLVYE